MTFFADASTQDTRGDRGKTTRRKSTRTVRGPEGAYIAMMKEELARAEAPAAPLPLGVIGTAYRVDCPHPSGRDISEYGVNAFWFGTEAEALAKAAGLPGATARRKRTVRYMPAGKRKPRERVEWSEVG